MKAHILIHLLLLTLIMPSPSALGARDRIRLSLGRYINLTAAGIRLRPLEGFVNSPMPTLDAFTYAEKPTGRQFEAYDPRELWLNDQRVAVFKGGHGTMTVGVLRFPLPSDLPLINDTHVRRADYERMASRQTGKWDTATITKWVEGFVGARVSAVADDVSDVHLEMPYTRYSFAGHNPEHSQGYIVWLPGRPVFVRFSLSTRKPVAGLSRTIARCLGSIGPIQSHQQATGPSERFQNRNGLRHSDRSRPEYEMTRRRVIENIRDLKDWWYVETPNYILTSNLSRRNRVLVSRIQSDIEIVRGAYARLFPPITEIREVSVIRVFGDRREYLNYVDKSMKWSGGLWMPTKKELVISPVQANNTRDQRESVLSVVYHEAFHQYLYYALDRIMPPIWFNEGHAAFFEACRLDRDGGGVQVLENPQRVKALEQLLQQRRARLDLKRIMMMSPPEFYATDHGSKPAAGQTRNENYAIAWGLVYFLRKAGPLYADGRYRNFCPTLMRVLTETRGDWRRASQSATTVVDMQRFTGDFVEFWQHRRTRRRAEELKLFRRSP